VTLKVYAHCLPNEAQLAAGLARMMA